MYVRVRPYQLLLLRAQDGGQLVIEFDPAETSRQHMEACKAPRDDPAASQLA